MNPSNDDKLLDEYLGGGSEVSRRYRSLGDEAPPAELDRIVLSQARAAVTAASRRRTSRWAVPAAAAATLVLSFFLLRGLGPETVMQRAAAPVAAPPKTEPAVAQPSVERPEVLEGRKIGSVEPEKLADIDAPPMIETQAAKRMRNATASAVTPMPPVPAAMPESLLGPSEALKEESENEESKPQPAAPAAFERGLQKAAQRSSLMSYDRVTSARPAALRSPQAWLEDIRKLRASGRQIEADAELKRFLAEHPDYFEKNPAVARP